jgi:hypothetical protein
MREGLPAVTLLVICPLLYLAGAPWWVGIGALVLSAYVGDKWATHDERNRT